MDGLTDFRMQIDEIDRQIVSLYEKRMNLSKEIGYYKIQHKKEVLDQGRECKKIESLMSMVSEEQNKLEIRTLYEYIMSASRKLQETLLDKNSCL